MIRENKPSMNAVMDVLGDDIFTEMKNDGSDGLVQEERISH